MLTWIFYNSKKMAGLLFIVQRLISADMAITKKKRKRVLKFRSRNFFRYTLNKKTLFIGLKRLGWKIKKGKFKKGNLESPRLASLITENDYLAETLNNKQFTKYDQSIAMPV